MHIQSTHPPPTTGPRTWPCGPSPREHRWCSAPPWVVVLLLPCRRLALALPSPRAGFYGPLWNTHAQGDVVYEAASLTAVRQSHKQHQRCPSSQSGAVGEFMRVRSHAHFLIYDQIHLHGEELIVSSSSLRSISTIIAASRLCAQSVHFRCITGKFGPHRPTQPCRSTSSCS